MTTKETYQLSQFLVYKQAFEKHGYKVGLRGEGISVSKPLPKNHKDRDKREWLVFQIFDTIDEFNLYSSMFFALSGEIDTQTIQDMAEDLKG